MPAQSIIESTYQSQAIGETGLDGGTQQDLVKYGTFEELRCIGGARDGLSCIVTSDCRVGQGVCVDDSPVLYSRVPCDKDVDCADAENRNGQATPICKYLITASVADEDTVDCPNPRMSEWLGVKRPGNGLEAGYDNIVMGIKNSAGGQAAVHVMIREDEENLEQVAEDARHAVRGNNVAEKHKKDGNNFLRATIKKDAEIYSGVGVPITQSIVEQGLGYVLSFKFRYESSANPQEPIKAQLAFNYEHDGDWYKNEDFEAFDFPIVQDQLVCFGGSEPGSSCNVDTDCAGGGTCGLDVDIPGTTEWQTFVLGPVVPSEFTPNKIPFLNFVTNADHNYDDPTVFFVDDVTLKPSLDVAYSHLTASDTKKIERRCRLYPKNESAECHYFDENGTEYKGWRGYCLDKDPQNPDLCLTWWPLDLLSGESPFTAAAKTGYDDRSPLYFCAQQQGGDKYVVRGERKCGGDENQCQWWYDLTGLNLRWRDIEKVVVEADSKDDKFAGSIDFDYNAITQNANNNDYEMVIKPNWDPAHSLWGWGAFCLFDGEGCTEQWNNGWDSTWADSCDQSGDHHDDQYMAAAVKIQNPNNPDAADAIIGHVAMKMCDDRENDFDGDGPYAYIIVYMRATCNAVVQVVKSASENNENKAWVKRTDQISNYIVPDLNYGYLSDKAPFGAMVTQPFPPEQWGGPTGWSNDAEQLDAMTSSEPTPGGSDRAGTPYSCKENCGSSDFNSKYCYKASYPDGPCENAACYGDGTNNRCQTRDQISNCPAGGVCVGRPLGHCTGNLLLACAADGDCAASGAGTCTSDTVGSNQNTYVYARDHLKKLFAKSFACWELQSVGPFNEDSRQVWHSKYVNGCSQPGGTWDVMAGLYGTPDDGDPQGGYCPGARGANDFCAIRPDVDENTFIIKDVREGDFTVPLGQTIRGGFSYQVDAEQKPLKNGTIDWEWDGSGSAEVRCLNAPFSGLPETGKVNQTHRYTAAGSYRPIACVKDNWGAIGYYVFPGIITAQ